MFGYGSLMWRPGFEFAELRRALLRGWSRRLCIYSHIYRGTAERPGLVMGLDRGGSCAGVAFRVPSAQWPAALSYLRERELVTNVYLERQVRINFGGDGSVAALTYVADRLHPQYAGRLDRGRLVQLVRGSRGRAGTNADYIFNTLAHLTVIGIRDAELEWLAGRLRREAAAPP